MKKSRAVRSASETQLRSNTTSYLGHKKAKGRLGTAVAAARIASALSDENKKGNAKSGAKKVSSERIESDAVSRMSSPINVKSERVTKNTTSRKPGALPGGRKAPAALPAPKPTSSKAKTSKKTKKETTPGVKTVFKATPVVDLREGPNFGKVTNEIEKTFQPKTPRTKKNA